MDTKSTLFVVQDNPRLDFTPAREFAGWPPRTIFGPGQITLSPQVALDHARNVLQAMLPDDYLLLTGDPVMIGICVTVAAQLHGKVRVLRWDRRTLSYLSIGVDFCAPFTLKGESDADGNKYDDLNLDRYPDEDDEVESSSIER